MPNPIGIKYKKYLNIFLTFYIFKKKKKWVVYTSIGTKRMSAHLQNVYKYIKALRKFYKSSIERRRWPNNKKLRIWNHLFLSKSKLSTSSTSSNALLFLSFHITQNIEAVSVLLVSSYHRNLFMPYFHLSLNLLSPSWFLVGYNHSP